MAPRDFRSNPLSFSFFHLNMFKKKNYVYRSSRPHSLGRFGTPRNRGSYRNQKSLPNDPTLFIRKATEEIQEEYVPQNSFSDFNLSPILKANIDYKGYTTPTPIQDMAILPILEGRDLIGLAATGTGKTAAFLIPLIQKMYTNRAEKTLIVTPTRELAVQIEQEFRDFAYDCKLYSALVIGGANMNRQIHDVRRSPSVVIATPGRLRDLIEHRLIFLEDYNNIVLDEVDLMVDIGFINDVKYFISLLPKVRQSLFFSATISSKVQTVLQSFVNNPVTVSVKKHETPLNIDQDVIRVENSSRKIDQLHDLLIQDEFEKVLIFGRTKHGIDKLHRELTFRGFKTGSLHGNKSQGQRQRTLESFKRSEIQILLATDVASRGLDIPNVSHVINYELPETFDDYIHRIGRTGRANNKGIALTFID